MSTGFEARYILIPSLLILYIPNFVSTQGCKPRHEYQPYTHANCHVVLAGYGKAECSADLICVY